jgi:SAM-dependent methyltransferase
MGKSLRSRIVRKLKKGAAHAALRLNQSRFKTDYLSAYAKRTDYRVAIDPAMAIGGLWEKMGRKQFDFLVSHGLQPHHRLLDIGCGTLRGGHHFIGYLDEGHYAGFDISRAAVAAGQQLLEDKGLTHKKARLWVSVNHDLKFGDVNGKYDFLLAQSVFSHLPPDNIRECLAHLNVVMDPGSKFFFTFHPGDDYRQLGEIDFQYPLSFFMDAADELALTLTDFSEAYAHPRGQGMILCQLAEGAQERARA